MRTRTLLWGAFRLFLDDKHEVDDVFKCTIGNNPTELYLSCWVTRLVWLQLRLVSLAQRTSLSVKPGLLTLTKILQKCKWKHIEEIKNLKQTSEINFNEEKKRKIPTQHQKKGCNGLMEEVVLQSFEQFYHNQFYFVALHSYCSRNESGGFLEEGHEMI